MKARPEVNNVPASIYALGESGPKSACYSIRNLEQLANNSIDLLAESLYDPTRINSWSPAAQALLRLCPSKAPTDRLIKIFFFLSVNAKKALIKHWQKSGLSIETRPLIRGLIDKIAKEMTSDGRGTNRYLIGQLKLIKYCPKQPH